MNCVSCHLTCLPVGPTHYSVTSSNCSAYFPHCSVRNSVENWRNSLSLLEVDCELAEQFVFVAVGSWKLGMGISNCNFHFLQFPLRQYTDETDCAVAPCHCSVLILTVPCRSVVSCPMTLFLCMNTHSHTHTTTRLTHSQTFAMHDSSLQRERE